jgi:phage gp36-like protein
MFATIEDLGAKIYDYQVVQITEGDNNIVDQALLTAEMEVKGYLSQNNKREHLDGRMHYDVAAIFSATGSNRHALLLTLTLTIAKWYIVELCNADIIYETAKERYDRATELLKKVAAGDINLSDLPTVEQTDETQAQTLRYGSRVKFNHE